MHLCYRFLQESFFFYSLYVILLILTIQTAKATIC